MRNALEKQEKQRCLPDSGPSSHMDPWSGTGLTWDLSLHLARPHRCLFLWYSAMCTHDRVDAAFGTLHRQIKYSTGCKSRSTCSTCMPPGFHSITSRGWKCGTRCISICHHTHYLCRITKSHDYNAMCGGGRQINPALIWRRSGTLQAAALRGSKRTRFHYGTE